MNLKRKLVTILLSLALVWSLASYTNIKASAQDSFSYSYPHTEITISCTLDEETVILK